MALMFAPPHPGEILAEWLEGLDDMNISKFAKKIQVTRATLSRIIHGHASITPEIAIRLEIALGASSEMWLGMQCEFDIWHARQNARPQIEVVARPFVGEAEAVYA